MTDLTQAVHAVELIRARASQRPEQDAIIRVRDARDRQDERLSYAELDRRARAIADLLSGRCRPGSRILLLQPPVDFTTSFLGCLYAGMVAVPAPLPGRFRHERRRVRGIAEDAGISAVLTDPGHGAEVEELVGELRLDGVEVLATDGADLPGDAWSAPAIGRDDLAMLQYTSGSTGDPKGVMVTHGNLLANAAALAGGLGIAEGTRFGGWAPQFHDMGLLAQTLPALFLGGSCALMTPTEFIKRPHQWLWMIDRYDIAWSPAPNFGYELCTRRAVDEELAGLDLSRWRYAVNGSEPVQVSTMEEFAERFAAHGFRAEAFSPCYGLAEATVYVSGVADRGPVAVRVDPDRLEQHEFVPVTEGGRRLVAHGPAADYEVRIADPVTGAELPGGRIGEIWLRGNSVARGYWQRPDQTEATFRAGPGDGEFLRTGDLGTVHDGELYLTGRRREVLIIRGRNLYPQDLEQEMRLRHPELGSVGAAFAVPLTGGGGEHAVVLTHEVRPNLPEDVLRDLARRMKHEVADEFGVSVGGIVLLARGGVRRTTSGKVQRAEMRSLFLAGDLVAQFADVDRRVPVAAVGQEGMSR
ncbi:fatty acyl-AMP ligase [Saccharopolyspora hirsuta]|uniref:fatty acyl-AMP ligase n=1 Tax=Saccharopolyspora hirsuta TaxID=1837 RepID=UPI0033281D8A